MHKIFFYAIRASKIKNIHLVLGGLNTTQNELLYATKLCK